MKKLTISSVDEDAEWLELSQFPVQGYNQATTLENLGPISYKIKALLSMIQQLCH